MTTNRREQPYLRQKHGAMHSRFLLPILAVALACTTTAQPTWRFPICLEDGTGARDTIWLVYDTTATVGNNSFPTVDYALGEGHVEMDHSKFNVWVGNWDNDSTKTVAFPYTEFPYHNATVYAFNYQYPVTIRWDLSLGAEPWLPQGGWPINGGALYNDYFYYFNNCGGPPCGYFDISLADSVIVVDAFPAEVFPVGFTLGHLLDTHVADQGGGETILLWPNPTRHLIHVSGLDRKTKATICDPLGRELQTHALTPADNILLLDNLPNGTYLLMLSNPNGHEFFKLVKMP
ncbi:MAG: T9SS type A sorting domain-containing protein [Flavobacteriales bacterium]|nr:T9SS type A sorting domain-containing protein [Flavobacteriales bacterium]MBP9080480.1 T9SS type A sorting domain-containing protein [Flavobacteriales bacterium]